MKQRHNVNQATLTPLTALKSNIDTDEYIVKPKLVLGIQPTKSTTSNETPPSPSSTEHVYMPEDIDKIPIRSIFGFDIKYVNYISDVQYAYLSFDSFLQMWYLFIQ